MNQLSNRILRKIRQRTIIRRYYEDQDPLCPNCGEDNCLPIHDTDDSEGGWYCPNCKLQF